MYRHFKERVEDLISKRLALSTHYCLYFATVDFAYKSALKFIQVMLILDPALF